MEKNPYACRGVPLLSSGCDKGLRVSFKDVLLWNFLHCVQKKGPNDQWRAVIKIERKPKTSVDRASVTNARRFFLFGRKNIKSNLKTR